MPDLAAWQPTQAGMKCASETANRTWSRCGPMDVGKLIALPDEKTGARRFAIVGTYVKPAGGTIPYQVSIWRWNGRAATPLTLRTFAQAIEKPVFVSQDQRGFTLRLRAEYAAFPACGACSGRQLSWRFALPAVGVAPLRTNSLSPEMDLVDSLYAARNAGKSATSFAAPTVVAAIRDVEVDMLKNWRLLPAGTAATKLLCVDADGFDRPQIFQITTRGGRPFIADVTFADSHACDRRGRTPDAWQQSRLTGTGRINVYQPRVGTLQAIKFRYRALLTA